MFVLLVRFVSSTSLPGSLDRPLFGLSQEQFRDLGASVDAIVHNGALVNWVLPFAQMKAANVDSTLDALRLCCSGGKSRPFIFISSSSVLDAPGYLQADQVLENDPLSVEQGKLLSTGYAQTK